MSDFVNLSKIKSILKKPSSKSPKRKKQKTVKKIEFSPNTKPYTSSKKKITRKRKRISSIQKCDMKKLQFPCKIQNTVLESPEDYNQLLRDIMEYKNMDIAESKQKKKSHYSEMKERLQFGKEDISHKYSSTI